MNHIIFDDALLELKYSFQKINKSITVDNRMQKKV